MFKIKLKEYWLHILMSVLLLLFAIFSTYSFIQYEKKSQEVKATFYNERCTGPEEEQAPKETCELSNPNYKHSFFSNFTSIVGFYKFPKGLDLVLILIIPACYITCRYLKSKTIFNELSRKSYNRVRKKLFLQSYISIITLMIIIIFMYIVCYLMSKSFTFQDWEYGLSAWSNNTMSKPIQFLILYFFINFFQSLFIINIVLIVCRKYHNFFTATLLSFLTLFGIELIMEIPIQILIFDTILKVDYGISFTVFGGLVQNDAAGLPAIFIMMLLDCQQYSSLH